MKSILSFFCLTLFSLVHGQPILSIENVVVALEPGNMMTITYDLLYPTNDLVEVTFRATARGGLVFDYNTGNATGDVGPAVSGGTGLYIEWDYSDYAGVTDEFRLMLVAKSNQGVDIQTLVDQVDSSRLIEDLTFLEGIRHPSTGAIHLAEVKEFIKYQFLDHKLALQVQEFPLGNYIAQNIIGRKIGIEEEAEVYLIDGHFDSVNNTPGADDNASAIAGMLEALRILGPYGFRKTIQFIGFDLEEFGSLGSFAYVEEGIEPEEQIRGVLNFEMIGYYSSEPNSHDTPVGFSLLFPDVYAALEANEFRGDFINIISNVEAQPLVAAYEAAINTYVPALHFISVEAPANWEVIASDLGRSDHRPFWLADIPAIMLTDGANFRNPYYHTPNDTSDKLNFTFMQRVVQAAIATLAELAVIENATTWWIDTDFTTPVREIESCRFQLSPNPAKDFLRITWPDCLPGDYSMDLIDIDGMIAKSLFLPGTPGVESQVIDLRGLAKGVYILRIKNEYGQWAKKLVVR